MARVCINTCGLKIDTNGKLGINTGTAVWPYACASTNGVPIICDTNGQLRLNDAPRAHIRNIQYTASPVSGELTAAAFGSPSVGGAQINFGVPLTYHLVNPSSCLPMTVAVRVGVHHGVFTKNGAGDSQALYGVTLSNNADSGTVDAHTAWHAKGGAAGEALAFDAMNDSTVITRTLAAGASITFTATPHIQVEHYNGDSSITSYIAVLDVEAWN